MASPRKSGWKTLQQFTQNLVFNEAPKFIRQGGIERGIKMGMQVLAVAISPPPAAITAGRPVTNTSCPTAQRARKLVYAPHLAGRADAGEIVWTWVADDDDSTLGADCPVLVIGRDRHTLLGLIVSSAAGTAEADWIEIGSSTWDYEGKLSWVRLDRVLDVPEEGIRREGIVLARDIFEIVASRLRINYSWR